MIERHAHADAHAADQCIEALGLQIAGAAQRAEHDHEADHRAAADRADGQTQPAGFAGTGADRFYTFAGAGTDRVTDFSRAEGDRVLVTGSYDAGAYYPVGGPARFAQTLLPAVRAAGVAVELGVDWLLGGTRPEAVLPIIAGTSIRYCPFPGRVVGHPSVLSGTKDQVIESARRMAEMDGVHGLDLLAYRFAGDVPALISGVCRATAATTCIERA